MDKDLFSTNPRRKFIGTIATAGAAAIGLSAITSPLAASAGELVTEEKKNFPMKDADLWFNQIKGKHRIVYDVKEAGKDHDLVAPFAWSKIFLLTNAGTGTPEKDNTVVVVFRHNGIPFAMEDKLWAKYKFGENFKINDPNNGAPSTRNMFWKPNPVFQVPGIGPVPIGIDDLQGAGVMFCVCDMALTVYSAALAEGMKMKGEDVKKEWLAGLLPNIQVVPSGVWALGRAQEHKCAYVNAS